jgi:low temperature requirement protein LtrA
MSEKGLERRASWIELFFDLVLVAGMTQLAHLLSHGPSVADLGLYALVYLAFWITWASFTVYGNVQAENARIRNMLLAMLGLAVMVAAVPGVREEHTTAFVVAYVALRWLAGAIYGRGQVVVDWPLAQYGAGALPWLLSLFFPSARYWLWAAGIALDLWTMFAASSNRVIGEAERRLDRVIRSRGLPPGQQVPRITASRTDAGHLAERMGLFVIIVLGEGVIQILTSASESRWTLALDTASLAAFAVLIGLWALSLLHGFAGVPGLEADALSTRHAMSLHAATTGALAALAAGLGMGIAHAEGHLSTGTRWLLCSSIAAYFLISAIGGLATHTTGKWLLGWALPGIALPIALGIVGNRLNAAWLIWLLAAIVGWQTLYKPLSGISGASGYPQRTDGSSRSEAGPDDPVSVAQS